MKNTIKLFGIIAFIAVIGFSLLACSKANSSGELDGTKWFHENAALGNMELSFNNGKYESVNLFFKSGDSGSYKVEGNNVTITKTHDLKDGKSTSNRGISVTGTLEGENTLIIMGMTFTKTQ